MPLPPGVHHVSKRLEVGLPLGYDNEYDDDDFDDDDDQPPMTHDLAMLLREVPPSEHYYGNKAT